MFIVRRELPLTDFGYFVLARVRLPGATLSTKDTRILLGPRL
jgi:hypothetical protein